MSASKETSEDIPVPSSSDSRKMMKRTKSFRNRVLKITSSFRNGIRSISKRLSPKRSNLSMDLQATKTDENKAASKEEVDAKDVWNEEVERNRRDSRGMKGHLGGWGPGMITDKSRPSFLDIDHDEVAKKRKTMRESITKFTIDLSSLPEEMTRKEKLLRKGEDILEHTATELFMMVLTIFALYASDLNVMYGSKSGDDMFGVVSLVTMIVFFAELTLASFVKPKYFLRAFFWLDFVAAISLISDIPWLAVHLLPSGFAAARAGRASRAGTRAGRLVRVIRLIRLTRLVKILNVAKKGEGDNDSEGSAADSGSRGSSRRGSTGGSRGGQQSTGEENAGAMTNQLTKLTTVKVIVGLLAMLIMTPFLDFTPTNESRIKGLEIVRDQIEMMQSMCPDESNNATFRCADMNLTRSVDEVIQSYISRFSTSDSEILHLVVDDVEVVNVRPSEGSRDCDCGFPILDGLRPGPTPPPEVVVIALGPEGDEYESTEDLQRYVSYVATFSDKETQDGDATESMLMTTFIIVLLIIGMIAFNNDARVISDTITVPLERISEEMNNVARMKLSVKTRMKASNVFEIRRMQRALLYMKKGIMSFAKFIPKDVVANMLASGQEASLGVVSRSITTFFSDIANFTTICEQMKPEELLNLLTEYFDSMSPLVINTGGSVLDYIGDAVLACWNAPQDVPLHGYACVLQALEMHKILEVMRVRWKKKGYPPVHIRCGIHTACAFVGNIGGTRRMKYSVLGDGVAMSERCEDGNKKYGSRVMITENTYREPKVATSFLTRKLDFIDVKDVEGPCAIYQVVCARKEATEDQIEMCAIHNRAIEHYRNQEFEKAIELFEKVLTYEVPEYVEENYDGEDRAATIMIKRCKQMIKCPPPLGCFDLAQLGAI